jgi:hypothetical protein
MTPAECERFLSRFVVNETTGCWLWTSTRLTDSYGRPRNGYGVMRIGRKMQRAHRLSYELHVGPIPDGLFVCHACDVPACVNPGHLWLGTQADNMRDKKRKGRARGGNSRLTESAA